ncbi:hypothetical protein PO909_020067 [Leuciscus waleckii]
MDIQQQYPDSVNNRWEDEWDNENSSARLFERSRIKALAGEWESQTYTVFNSKNATSVKLFSG